MGKKFSPERARELQKILSMKVIDRDVFVYPPKLICGVDASYVKGMAIAAAALLDFQSLKVVEESVISCEVEFPYVPGFLAFRELRPIVLALKKLRRNPDLILVDGHGRAHPRFFGLACHVGLAVDTPSIGVAKKKLCGEILLSSPIQSNVYPILLKGKVLGAAIQVKSKFIYVSIGHKISLNSAIKVVSQCISHQSVPEPIRVAHNLCKSFRSCLN
ncbi:MAG: endonuclease V [archaeon GB-1867-005]|nr:endonuclease V [Candidatus Culexmicrobium cathedralense]